MPIELHKHVFTGDTSSGDGHLHYYIGRTNTSPDVPGHTHKLSGQINLSDGHIHQFELSTGPEIIAGIGHRHYYKGKVGYSQCHDHTMEGYTTID